MPKSVLHELRFVADTNNNLIEDVSSGASFTFNGRSHVYCTSVAAGTKKLPDAGIGTQATFTAAGAVSLTNSAGTAVVTLASGDTVTVQVTSRTSAGVSTWKTVVAAAGATISDAGSYTDATNVETALQRLMRDTQEVHVDLSSALDADGDPLAKFVDNASPNPGFNLANSEAFGIRWNNNATQNQPVLLSCTIPRSYDANDSVLTCHVVASKIGATVGDATTFTIAAFAQIVGNLHDSESDLGGATSAMTGNATSKTVQRVTREMTNTSGVSATTPTKLTFTITPTSGTLGTDDVIVHDVYFTWTSEA